MQTDRQEDDLGAPEPRVGDRRLAAIMFTDIVGYTGLTQSNEALALELLEEHRQLLRQIIAAHGGEEIQTIGDSFLIEFRSALDAVKCAIDMQQALSRRNLESTSIRQIQVRIGIHVGDVVRIGKDVYGDTVNLAKRIESLSEPNGIAISAQACEQVRNKIPISIEKMEEHRLKNVSMPMLIYKIRATRNGKPTSVSPDRHSRFAVLPFLNIGLEDEYLADGLTEELISAFSHLPGIKVVARTTMMRYRNSQKSILEIGNELNVSTILEGSVRKYGNQLRVTVQLIETNREECLWSDNYDSSLEDILRVQQDVALKTVEALRSRMVEKQAIQAGPKKSTESPEAFLLYLRGKYHLARHTEDEVRLAMNLFERATQIDPNYASAHAMFAQCHMFLGFFGFISPKEGFEKALPALNRAIAIDRDLDIAHMLMGRLLQDKWDWAGAEAEFRRAIEISPNSAEAHYRYALLLNDLRAEEALVEVKTAVELDPLSVPVNQIAGTIMCAFGRYRDAIERFQSVLDIDPKAVLAQNNLGLALFEDGREEEGLASIRKATEMDPKNVMFQVDLCYALSRSGRENEAKELLLHLEERASNEHVPPVAVAGMYASLGDRDKAVKWLEKAYSEHSPYLASLRVDRWFDKIRKDPEFVAILKKVGLRE